MSHATIHDMLIRTQVTRIDLKIDLALCEVFKRYKRLIKAATGTAYAVGGSTIHRKVATNQMTKSIISEYSTSACLQHEAQYATVCALLSTTRY